ncbi:MAG: hypothetical protein ACXW2Q_07155 [Thermoanaerobaculia bacterium]
MSSVSRDRNRFLFRVFSAAGVLLFVGAFFAAPLANAWMLCTMPCCHPGAGVTKIVANTSAPCESEECTISAPEAPVPVASPVAKSSPAAAIYIDAGRASAADAPAVLVELQPDTSPHGLTPIHVLNSTFRI